MQRFIALITAGQLSVVLFTGCLSLRPSETTAEQTSGYTYVPVDPFAIDMTALTNQILNGTNLLQMLPDNAVRVSVAQFDANGEVRYGPGAASAKGGSYKITVDYINADTITFPVYITKSLTVRSNLNDIQGIRRNVLLSEPAPWGYVPHSEVYYVEAAMNTDNEPNEMFREKYNIPIYVGIGLRVTAYVKTEEAKLNISGLGAISAYAAQSKLNGSLVVQTLGINGKSISAALPIQSELNQTTAQNAITSVGAIKALLYESETVVRPRVVGMYLPFHGGQPLVNGVISALSAKPLKWPLPEQMPGLKFSEGGTNQNRSVLNATNRITSVGTHE
jgi:hypothetical protein